jgi:hypothetical protein
VVEVVGGRGSVVMVVEEEKVRVAKVPEEKVLVV